MPGNACLAFPAKRERRTETIVQYGTFRRNRGDEIVCSNITGAPCARPRSPEDGTLLAGNCPGDVANGSDDSNLVCLYLRYGAHVFSTSADVTVVVADGGSGGDDGGGDYRAALLCQRSPGSRGGRVRDTGYSRSKDLSALADSYMPGTYESDSGEWPEGVPDYGATRSPPAQLTATILFVFTYGLEVLAEVLAS
ncbi:hypothetical protein HZH66_014889 [Vespula vulgaris]|uniref:Uncharacterized protein n=1 Tax=Vespula vulgaris TaxID=7454 RepID=A0A834MQT5_VESVU|nr:hypothetical protein HZH66_014889 [Vespula vulgaris]